MGENALERTVRLLKRLNDRIADPDVADMQVIGISIAPDGGCDIKSEGILLKSFDTTEAMMKFLEAPLGQQVKEMRVGR
jgi:hypothetical protein